MKPLVSHISSTWTIGSNSGSSAMNSVGFQAGMQAIKSSHCANMAIIGSMNVDPGHEVFDPTCNQWNLAP
jgi:hypothetical protein